MRKTRKTTADLAKLVKEAKRQKLAHHAQRKFASNFPSSPSQEPESLHEHNQGMPNSEDFIEFLCVRNNPILPKNLEVFAQPLVVPRTRQGDDMDIFDTDDSEMNERLSEIDIPKYQPNVSLSRVVLEDRFVDSCSIDSDYTVDSELIEVFNQESSATSSPASPLIPYLPRHHATMEEMSEFIPLLSVIDKSMEPGIIVTPPKEWIVPEYVEDEVKFCVETKHIHRLKHPLCDNFLTLLCIKRQLETESDTQLDDIPTMSQCEIDLPALLETVKTFGGLETVNSSQNWKVLADYLSIPKSASRRVSRLEDMYLKYLLPYSMLSDNNKKKLSDKIKRERNSQKEIPMTKVDKKKISLEKFHRFVFNCEFYWKQTDSDLESIENYFWDIINNGNKHVGAISATVELIENTPSYKRMKNKPTWNLQNLNSVTNSALKYVGNKISGVNYPELKFEGIFSTSCWSIQEHGFYQLSYMHTGAAKIWYIIPKDMKEIFLKLQNKFKHFVTVDQLLENNCQVHKCIQNEGEYIILEPGSYYLTISTGYSCSELVCYSPMHWFLSPDALGFQPKLNDFIYTKMFLLLALEESRKNEDEQIYEEVILSFLEQADDLVSKNLNRLQKMKVDDTRHVKLIKSLREKQCVVCEEPCFLITVLDDDNDAYCVGDAINMINKKRLKRDELSVEYISVESLEKKFS